ncbi:NFX1-type zinc finger-containing protein 1-like [Argiope bruennichi]|uniref:NFX1-type zinc finger-containing protein 1 n=1 Tax=Argiope bruennichi TaxID=94029 RepID=A0A8T0E9T9_ARGBR|nr:NFX1-type zinc finger-containing protein 1-like [Argiope bruennichi]XP_055935926.1 NFX1-type zinc finger-containing protein 1-like [Argiope bruennichi]KAF8768116.1 NFX1-type zinc finger-containing protein 1 [Argiope bruennichi]
MANSKSNSVYAVWNRLDNGDEDVQFNHSEIKNEKEFSKFRRNEPTGGFRGIRSNNPPTRGNSTRNYEHQIDRRENFRNVDSFQTSNRFEQLEEPQMNRNRYRDKKNNNVSNQSYRNNNTKTINSVQNSNQPSRIEDSRTQSNQRSHSSNRRVRNRNMKQSKSTQNLDQVCQLEDSDRFANQHNNRDFPNKYEDTTEDGNIRGNHIIKPMHLNQMKKLSEKDPTEVLLTITDRENGFTLLLNQNMRRDFMPYILIVLGKAVAASSNMHNNVCKMINTITSHRNFFLVNIQQYLASFQMQKPNEYHLDSLVSFTEFLHKFQITLPSNASEIIPILLPLLKTTCEKFLSGNRASIATSKLKEIDEQNTYVLEKYTSEKEVKKSSQNERLQFVDPPENYRSIPILPNVNDIRQPCSFLRANVVQGQYQNTEHYLDVQYRLLREDYVKPLRDGIAEYLRLKKQNKPIKKCKDVRVYSDMQIMKQEFVNGGLVHMACFNDPGFARIKWDFSKRFLTGALLCLSSDDFETMHFATVARRDSKELSKGLLYIRFEELTDFVLSLNPLIHFVVIETSAYFEAYRYNLDALLQLNENTLPLKRYIIETQKSVHKPEYLSATATYDMRPLLLPLDNVGKADGKGNFVGDFKCPASVTERVKDIPVLEENRWPTSSELNLDPSQYAALKAAVTKEFAIIQGPPGTGKTYVGLRIAQLLLHNVSKWQSERNPSPILVICYTNHALDQFLEGLLLFTQKIVRVGGRGKNEAISQYQLNNLKKIIKAKREVPHYIFSNIRQKNYELYRLKEDIDRIRKRVDISALSVLGEGELKDHISPSHYTSLKSIGSLYRLKDDGHFVEDWLGTRVSAENQFGNSFEIVVKKKDSNHVGTTGNVSNTVDNTPLGDDEDAISEGEADIEYIEAQRDINSEEFADVSYEMPNFDNDDEEIDIVPVSADGWQYQGGRKKIKKYIRHYLKNSKAMTENEERRVNNVWMLPIEQRWRLYKLWLERFIKMKEEEGLQMQEMLRNEYNLLCEMRTEEDIYVCKQALVVGMTTTGAAKYRHIVQNLNPRILIVEEAAEILESHIVTSLTHGTQHVILIGDHQQLRPSPTVHLLATKYNLNVSLFERMVQNGLDCYRLDIQHRMRPEIASLLVPHIYSNLQNHESVKHYENIKGVSKNVFFLTHEFNESQEFDSKSKVNEHEAKFIIKLCKYLILQGYSPSQITVLTTYSGQLFELKRQNDKKSFLQEVKFTVVDNYQGEENDIILISFVRSNVEGEIGFLKVANRVCVSLSRAKKGLFCIGNFNLLAEKSELWKNIVETLKQNNAIGPSLQLMCQNHPGVSNIVQNDQDFDSVPEGGCSRKCEYRLSCGHVCSLMCHPYDSEHLEIRCLKPCSKKCDYGHPCTKKCYKDCAPCETRVSKTIPGCDHVIQIPCHLRDTEITCSHLCDRYLPCGHLCSNKCSEPCVLKCMEKVRIKSIVCNHRVVIECSEYDNIDLLVKRCKEPCRTELFCGHMCSGTCGKCRQGRLHIACRQPCKRILVCGHECKSPCSESCPPCQQPCANECSHSKCPKICGEPCEKCTELCEWECAHKKCNQICGDPCDRSGCDEPCPEVLECGHPCIGVCGEPCPKECRECNEEVKDIFFGSEDEADARFVCLEDCKHIFELQGITQWMMTDIQKTKAIQMKACPRCKTVIRKNLRFGNIIKSCLADIEKVKKRTFGDKELNIQKQSSILEKVETSNKLKELDLIYRLLLKFLTSGRMRSIQELTSIENIINIALTLVDATHPIYAPITTEDAAFRNSILNLQTFMENNKQWLICFMQNEILTASEQQLKELSWEVHRLKLAGNLLSLIKKVPSLSTEAKTYLDKLLSIIITFVPFKETNMKNFTSNFQHFAELAGRAVINISEMEKQSILKAMGLTKGHWYQCPNGHVYCITECGGANQESFCNECGERIGGSNHRLIATNRVATDMDGATHSAWSDAMNMLNYRF